MLHILEIIFPVFAVVGLGYFIAYRRILDERDLRGLSRFVFKLALPFLLFDSLANALVPDEFQWGFMLAYYGVTFFIFGLGILISRAWFKAEPAEQGIFGLGASYSNLVLVGLPIMVAAFGDQATLPLFALISVQSLLMFPLVSLIAQRSAGRPSGLRVSIRDLLENPILLGLGIGFAFQLLDWQLPGLLNNAVSLIGQAGLPCALVVLGASLREYRVSRPDSRAWTMIGLKLLLQPVLVWVLVFVVLEVEPLWAAVAVMAAGMPTGINAYVLAEQHQAGIETVSTSIVVTTLLTIAVQAFYLAIFT